MRDLPLLHISPCTTHGPSNQCLDLTPAYSHLLMLQYGHFLFLIYCTPSTKTKFSKERRFCFMCVYVRMYWKGLLLAINVYYAYLKLFLRQVDHTCYEEILIAACAAPYRISVCGPHRSDWVVSCCSAFPLVVCDACFTLRRGG